MKKFLILLLAALLLAAVGFAAFADTYSEDGSTIYYDEPYIGKTAESEVVMRASAYSRGAIVDILRKGIKLTITAARCATDNSLWYAAETTKGLTGWVPAEQVVFEDDAWDGEANLFGAEGGGYIGNINTHVYHLPSCRLLPKGRNRIYFDTVWEAITEGYRPCSVCNP